MEPLFFGVENYDKSLKFPWYNYEIIENVWNIFNYFYPEKYTKEDFFQIEKLSNYSLCENHLQIGGFLCYEKNIFFLLSRQIISTWTHPHELLKRLIFVKYS